MGRGGTHAGHNTTGRSGTARGQRAGQGVQSLHHLHMQVQGPCGDRTRGRKRTWGQTVLKGFVSPLVRSFHMSERESMKKLGRLLGEIASVEEVFLKRCSEVTLLAMTDYPSALKECLALASDMFDECTGEPEDPCCKFAASVKSALERGELDQSLVADLRSLRQEYVQAVLQPAVRSYLIGDNEGRDNVVNVYAKALAIDRLLDLMALFQRVSRRDPSVAR